MMCSPRLIKEVPRLVERHRDSGTPLSAVEPRAAYRQRVYERLQQVIAESRPRSPGVFPGDDIFLALSTVSLLIGVGDETALCELEAHAHEAALAFVRRREVGRAAQSKPAPSFRLIRGGVR